MRYFIELKYNGAAYFGWQRQNDVPTIQGTIESALTTLLRTPIEIVGAGRTDTGVNASYYVAHFDSPKEIDEVLITYKLNVILPKDIAIIKIAESAPEAHARFDAEQREYTYFIERRKNPFTQHSSWQYFVDLDLEKMNQAATLLTKYDDFTSFAKLNSNNKTNICTVYYAVWHRDEKSETLEFKICANRFLRNMVRAIVGTLVDVGRGKYTLEEFEAIIQSKCLSRSSAGAPAQGLFLSDVKYPYEV